MLAASSYSVIDSNTEDDHGVAELLGDLIAAIGIPHRCRAATQLSLFLAIVSDGDDDDGADQFRRHSLALRDFRLGGEATDGARVPSHDAEAQRLAHCQALRLRLHQPFHDSLLHRAVQRLTSDAIGPDI